MGCWDPDGDAAAYAEARQLGTGDTLFKCIAVNGLFRLAGNDETYRKLTPRFYCKASGDGHRFLTGARSAVFLVYEEESARCAGRSATGSRGK